MGSSPVTATMLPPRQSRDLAEHLAAFLERHAPRANRVAVAFSGGSDSCAALLAARACAGLEVLALHVDHHLDPGSTRRAHRALALAREIGVPCEVIDAPPSAAGQGPEAAARHARYRALEATATRAGFEYIVIAHHRGDQGETVLLRWIAGSTLVGLAGMRPVRGRLLRPFLTISRAELAAAVAVAGIEPIVDPTNLDLAIPRNALRHRLVPALGASLCERITVLADRAAALRVRLEPELSRRLGLTVEPGGAGVDLAALQTLPAPLWPFALQLLATRAGRHLPPRAGVRDDLQRRLAAPSALLRIDVGDGWRLERHARRLCLLAEGRTARPFAYTLRVPGEREIPEIEASVRIRPASTDVPSTDTSDRFGVLTLPAGETHRVVVRSRRPGDRFQPLGSTRTLPLRKLLIDWHVRRDLRDRLPLLEVDGEIAWIGGIAVAEPFRSDRDGPRWLIEQVPNDAPDPEDILGRKGIS